MKNFFRSNLEVLWQVLLFTIMLVSGWATPTEIVIIYAIETVIIGAFHALKMLIAGFGSTRNSGVNALGWTLFFAIHYGFFTFIQTTFFFVFLSMSDDRIVDDFGLQNFQTALGFEGVQIAIAVLSVSLLIRLYRNFIRPARYLTVDIKSYMFVPYLRIVIQQFVAILPGFFIIFFDGGYVAAFILILLRAILEMFLNRMKTNAAFTEKCVNYLAAQSAKNEKGVDKKELRDFLQLVLEE